MDTLMSAGLGAWRGTGIVASSLVLALQISLAQKKPVGGETAGGARAILVEKAHELESRGRPDMAIQIWQQVLLSDPKNVGALGGLAKDLKLIGATDKANDALERLRKINPNDANIPKVQALPSTRVESEQLHRAGELARQGKLDDAMRIYRELYGDQPPDGDIALAYYETLYGTANGKQAAIEGIRSLTDRNPGDSRFAIELGTLLTYDARTRAEGIRVLQAHPTDANAQSALRQALIWDSPNPASAAELRRYLNGHPKDSELTGHLKHDEAKLAQMNSGIARTPAERAAFAALNEHKADEAEKLLTAILEKEPTNGRAEAGMGFLRMQQHNFGGAISYLTQAEENGYKAKPVEDGLETSRFWFTMSEATDASRQHQLDVALAKYRAALAMQAQSPEALNGLAGVLMEQRQYAAAAGVYEQLVKVQPESEQAWRGLYLAYARGDENEKALAVPPRVPSSVKTALAKDPEYLRTLAMIYQAENRTADAQRVLALALSLPFPDNGMGLKADTKLEYAGILMAARRFDQAAALYAQMLSDDAGNLPAWIGEIGAHHQLGKNQQAIADVEKMTSATYESALADPGFLSLLGAIYQQMNKLEVAQGLVERAVKLTASPGRPQNIALELQLAGIYLERNNAQQAYELYQSILTRNPARADAWKGLIAALESANRNSDALQQMALIPAAVRKQLETDIEFEQSEAGIYAALGDNERAVEYMNRVQAHYDRMGTQVQADVAIQNAWLLYSTGNDRLLYAALMRLGGRTDLTVPQRETIQNIWANWSVRRAGTAMDKGDAQRAEDILDAASQAFPDNMTVRKAVAGGYARVGRAKESEALYETVPMQDTTPGDFEGAVGAALAANDKAQAEAWLRQALERYPKDGSILSLAARFEQALGDNQRAAAYYRAALAAMPKRSPTDKLAYELSYPEQDTHARRAITAGDLQRLLDPSGEPFEKTTGLPPLPEYGPDPYEEGSAPVTQSRPIPTEQGVPAQPDLPRNPAQPADESHSGPDADLRVPAGTVVEAHSKQSSVRDQRLARKRDSPPRPTYTGRMNLPPSKENIDSTEMESTEVTVPISRQTQVWTTAQSQQSHPLSTAVLQITAQPMDAMAAQAQALFAEQTDGQLTQGWAAQIHAIAKTEAETSSQGVGPGADRSLPGMAQYAEAQYTPSAQEAASGAYSARKQKTQPQQSPTSVQAPSQAPVPTQASQTQQCDQQVVRPCASPAKKPTKRKPATAKATDQSVQAPTLGQAAVAPEDQQQEQTSPEVPATAAPSTPPASDTGVSDEQLQQRDLPPLRGPWVRTQRQPRPIDPRDEAEMQLRSIESGYSPWLGGNGIVGYRSGALGYDHLSALEAPFEASMQLGYNARVVFVAKPVFLDSGQADGTSTLAIRGSSTSGTILTSIPQPLGTDFNTVSGSTAIGGGPPAQQNAVGVGGEAQLIFQHLALAGGYTPAGFLAATFTGRAQWNPGGGPLTFSFSRDPIKDTQLSYAGLRDPGSMSISYPGNIWGGVVANQGNAQFAHGDAESGFYVGAGGQYLTGQHVQNNIRIEGNGGAYWRLKTVPEYGTLSVGANFFGMHYSHNEDAFTYGMGGYFSPQDYFLANIPFSWTGHYQTHWHYNVMGSLGVQAFQESVGPLFPLDSSDEANESVTVGTTIYNDLSLPAKTSVGPNYDFRSQVAYQIGPHWFAGGFLSANNSRDYNAVSAGFSIHYMFRVQPSTAATPTGLFPTDGIRPFTVP
jgi:tetratricopeptide (TPR) repeat protein